MNREERFHRSVDVLATAYREGNLQSSECQACAVGNLCADAMGMKVGAVPSEYGARRLGWIKEDGSKYSYAGFWLDPLFRLHRYSSSSSEEQVYSVHKEGAKQILATGYTSLELDTIERAFEGACKAVRVKLGKNAGYNDDSVHYAGLVAVYDALCTIHEVEVIDRVEADVLFFKEEKPEYAEMMVEISE